MQCTKSVYDLNPFYIHFLTIKHKFMSRSIFSAILFGVMMLVLPFTGRSQNIQFDKKTVYQIALEDISKHERLIKRLQQRNKDDENIATLRSEGELNLSNSKEAESEIHAAINPQDSNNIVVASMQYSEDQVIPFLGNSNLKIVIYYTKDGGKSWKKSNYNPLQLPLLTLPAGGGDPVLAFDHEGRVYLSTLVIYAQIIGLSTNAELKYAVSSDGGANWVSKGNIEALKVSLTDFKIVDKEWIASDQFSTNHRGNLYCAFTEVNATDTTYDVFVRRKLATVDTFERVRIPITKNEFAFAQFVTIDVGRNGTVHLLFAGAKPEDEILSLFYCNSTDGGKTFSKPQKTVEIVVPCFPKIEGVECSVPGFLTERLYPCPSITVDKSTSPSGGNLYITWNGLDIYQQKGQTGMEVFLIRSGDGGKTWTAPKKLNSDKLNGIEQFQPSCYVNDKGRCIVSWYDRRESANNEEGRYYMTHSCDGGASFVPEMPVSGQGMNFVQAGKINGGFGVGEYTQVVATGTTAFPFWADGRSNNGNLEVVSSRIPLVCNRAVAVRDIRNLSKDLVLHSLFPNPVKAQLQLDVEADGDGILKVKCNGIDGRILFEQQKQMLNGRQTIALQLNSLPLGSYWLELTFKESRIARQLVKVE